jgi:hypothetical protein
MVEFESTGPSIDDSDLDQLEQEISGRLPDAYRRFLKMHNGGLPSPDTVDVPGLASSPTDIQLFFGIGGANPARGIAWNRATFADRVHPNLLPIACDSGGALYLLSLEAPPTGRVIFHDPEVPSMYLEVAPDFDSFLAMIRSF